MVVGRLVVALAHLVVPAGAVPAWRSQPLVRGRRVPAN